MTGKPYPTDLSDEEWKLIEPLLGQSGGVVMSRTTACGGSSRPASTSCAAVFRGA